MLVYIIVLCTLVSSVSGSNFNFLGRLKLFSVTTFLLSVIHVWLHSVAYTVTNETLSETVVMHFTSRKNIMHRYAVPD